ncbi:hypothetical protein [Flexithrix dorotheae]|uniref:hypothetical protein n=1 Tax=Flexithrix dorotheae TaxID=70993 RepID=UPI00036B5D2B|nr:hypothetical protein [Flexithrix dorotheae]
MTRKKIVLASVLKPIDDTRMFEKFGQSLAGDFEVHIIGYKANVPAGFPNLFFYPLFDFSSKKQKRLRSSQLFLDEIQKIKPDVLIVHAVELLPAAMWYKTLHRKVKLIYDVRENYFRNIIYQPNYKGLFKYVLAFGIRFLEILSRVFVTHYILAERNYDKEFWFARGKNTILENKYRKIPHLKTRKNLNTQSPVFIHGGTLSEVYGTLEAINFVEQLRLAGMDARLHLIGNVASENVKKRIAGLSQKNNYICATLGNPLIPHYQLMEAYLEADFALLSYKPNNSTSNCIPTKLYECLANQIPMVIQNNALWENICKPYEAALFIDFENFSAQGVINTIREKPFYTNVEGISENCIWDNREEKLLLELVLHALNK